MRPGGANRRDYRKKQGRRDALHDALQIGFRGARTERERRAATTGKAGRKAVIAMARRCPLVLLALRRRT
jgi:hypothetical protein